MPCRATQDGWVMVKRSNRMWSIGEGNGKALQYSCLENPMSNMKRQKDRTLKDELPRSVGAQYSTGDQWRNNSRKKEGIEPKQNQHHVVVVYNSFYLDSTCQQFIVEFCIHLHRRHSPVVFLPCNIFIWFCFLSNTGIRE